VREVRIGSNRKDVKENLRHAIASGLIDRKELVVWFRTVEGWGKQHLYMMSASRRTLALAHLLNTRSLDSFLVARGLRTAATPEEEPASPYVVDDAVADDALARITWRAHVTDHERHEDLDEVRELEDGIYEFRAFRRLPRRSASHLLIRKADGIILALIDVPLQRDDHPQLLRTMNDLTRALLAPITIAPVNLSPIVSNLDQGAIATYGRIPTRPVALEVEPTQARYRTDGARVEFKSTSEISGYADSEPARHVRRALKIANFEGEAGKFRLTFEGPRRQPHDMIVSLNAYDNRVFLFSRMSEDEVLALVDQLISLQPRS
jgi:hypothetical protein